MEIFNTIIPNLHNPESTQAVACDNLFTVRLADRPVTVGVSLEGEDTSHLGPRLLVTPSGMTQAVGLEELPSIPNAGP